MKGMRVLLRAGFDVPMENGQIKDTTRMEAMVPTMKYILDHGASLILMAHQGRPDGIDLQFSQRPLVPLLERMLSATVTFADSCAGESTLAQAKALKPGEVLLLENLRFHSGEKSKDPLKREALAKELAALADLYVDDAFTNAHRDHASMTGVPKIIPGYLGLNIQKEVNGLGKAVHNPVKPVTLIISGAKTETKIPVIENFMKIGDDILVGGCIANTLLAAKGFEVGGSKYDRDFLPQAKELLAKSGKNGNATIHLPSDVLCAPRPAADAAVTTLAVTAVPPELAIFDMGPMTTKEYCDVVATSKTVVWNGPLGFYEVEKFAVSTGAMADAVRKATEAGAVSIIGGGDTLDFHDRYSVAIDRYTFVSTAGGAMLDFISGVPMPALEVLVKP